MPKCKVPDVRQFTQTAVLDFERVAPDAEEIELDAIGFELERVRLDTGTGWQDATYEYDGNTILIRKLTSVAHGKIEVRYRATPRRGLYFLAPDEKVKHRRDAAKELAALPPADDLDEPPAKADPVPAEHGGVA